MWLGAAFTICVLVALASGVFGLLIIAAAGMSDSPQAADDAMVDARACGLVFLLSCVGLAFLAWLH